MSDDDTDREQVEEHARRTAEQRAREIGLRTKFGHRIVLCLLFRPVTGVNRDGHHHFQISRESRPLCRHPRM